VGKRRKTKPDTEVFDVIDREFETGWLLAVELDNIDEEIAKLESISAISITEELQKKEELNKLKNKREHVRRQMSTNVTAQNPEELVDRLRSQGISDKKVLAQRVDAAFPGLSLSKLGDLLPANPGTITSYYTKVSQGQRLRGKK